MILNNYVHGTFGCPALCSGDAAESKAFYSGLLGWQPAEMDPPHANAAMFKIGDEVVAGMYQMADERKKAGVVPHWNNYIIVDDIAEVVRKAPILGGKVLAQPFDAMGDLMANLEDPYGAKFSVWQSRTKPTPSRVMEVGALCWTELYTTDMAGAEKFYTELLGWRTGKFEASPMPYTMITPAALQQPIGGILKITEEMGGRKPQWMPYFQITDADKSAAQAKSLGAQVHGPIEIPTIGRMLMIMDPQTAGFAVIQLNCGGTPEQPKS